MQNHSVGDPELNRLYELIWKRTIACQMSDAELEKTTARIGISTNNEELTASGEVIKFDGFSKYIWKVRMKMIPKNDGDESRQTSPLASSLNSAR